MKTGKRARRRKSDKRIWSDVIVLIVLVVLGSWTYRQFSSNYSKMEASNKITQPLLTHQVNLTQKYQRTASKYKQELGQVKEKFDNVEFVFDNARVELAGTHARLSRTRADLAKVKKENNKLRQKIQLLDTVADLESTISRLKQKNSLLVTNIDSIKQESFPRAQNIKTLQEGRSLMARYHDRLRKVKGRINELKRRERLERIAAQKESDRILLLAGNNGYLVRDGKFSRPTVMLSDLGGGTGGVPSAAGFGIRRSPSDKDFKIKVTFVK